MPRRCGIAAATIFSVDVLVEKLKAENVSILKDGVLPAGAAPLGGYGGLPIKQSDHAY